MKNINKIVKRLFTNSITSIFQVLITSSCFFILYRFLINTIGVERLGIWSAVLATLSMTNIASLGLSNSVVKFVAKYVARGEETTVSSVIQTSCVFTTLSAGLILFIIYPFANWLLGLVIPPINLKEALSVFPFALFYLWITIVSSIFQAGLDGFQRIDIKNKILIVSTLFNLILCFFFVPMYGLIGLGYCFITQALIILLGSWVFLKQNLRILPIIPYKWNYKLFKEMISYGFSFQIISICIILSEPITKWLIAKFGGLAMLAFFEMANKMLMQFRSLLVSANAVLVPAVADLQEKNPSFIQSIYRYNYHLMFYISLLFYSIIIAITPLISEYLIGYYESTFVIFSLLLGIGLFINTLSVPAYSFYSGIGELKWITLSHVITAILNIILGFIGGYIFGGFGVVISWVFSSIIGSFLTLISYHYNNKIEFLPKESKGIIITSLIVISFAHLLYYIIKQFFIFTTSIIFIIVLSTSLIIIFFSFWHHPMRKQLIDWICINLLKGKNF
jgi:O-antigen/teichoic acid export membrane protein